jgi:hypothetical protein
MNISDYTKISFFDELEKMAENQEYEADETPALDPEEQKEEPDETVIKKKKKKLDFNKLKKKKQSVKERLELKDDIEPDADQEDRMAEKVAFIKKELLKRQSMI